MSSNGELRRCFDAHLDATARAPEQRDLNRAVREQLEHVTRIRQIYGAYQQDRDLITVGAYRRGTDPRVDLAIAYWPRILEFLKQDMYEPVSLARSYQDLVALSGAAPAR